MVGLLVVVLLGAGGLAWHRNGKANAQWLVEGVLPWSAPPSYVTVRQLTDGSFRYIVNGSPQVFIGMGYNAIYRDLSAEEREANYRRDFRILCEANVNHLTGWDKDKGYEQDRFDELTLDVALQYGIGVVLPFYLPPEGNYDDEAFLADLRQQAEAKILRFRGHPGLRMWSVGNEVLTEMPRTMYRAFGRFYLRLADLFHDLDPNHPVIYREAEDVFIPGMVHLLSRGTERPWFLYGANVYTAELERVLDDWPGHDFGRPLFVSEFGAEPDWPGGRALGYVSMWRMIRSHPEYVLGGAPYVWTTQGPEPVDKKWGLMDGASDPVDDTFAQLAEDWRRENG